MLKHVLVPLDGSQLAEEALKYATNVVDPRGKITLVAAVDLPEAAVYGYYPALSVTDVSKTIDDMIPVAKHYLDGVAGGLTAKGFTVDIMADMGDPAELITSTAVARQVDAIIMSTHGRSGLGRWLFGSVTNKVLNAKPCPVFVIPSNFKASEKARSA